MATGPASAGVRGPRTALLLSSVCLSLQSLFQGTQPMHVRAGDIQRSLQASADSASILQAPSAHLVCTFSGFKTLPHLTLFCYSYSLPLY